MTLHSPTRQAFWLSEWHPVSDQKIQLGVKVPKWSSSGLEVSDTADDHLESQTDDGRDIIDIHDELTCKLLTTRKVIKWWEIWTKYFTSNRQWNTLFVLIMKSTSYFAVFENLNFEFPVSNSYLEIVYWKLPTEESGGQCKTQLQLCASVLAHSMHKFNPFFFEGSLQEKASATNNKPDVLSLGKCKKLRKWIWKMGTYYHKLPTLAGLKQAPLAIWNQPKCSRLHR